MNDLTIYIEFINQLGDATAGLICQAFRSDKSNFIMKEDKTPVTEADKEVEQIIRKMIKEKFPEHGIFGEEYENEQVDAEYIWVIDPIDGTKGFAAGLYGFATLIALTHNGVPILGMINQPVTNDRWVGATGLPTTYNKTPVSTRTCDDLSQAVLAVSSPHYYKGNSIPPYHRLIEATCWTVYGGSCLSTGSLVNGFIDLCLEVGFDPTDYLALVPIVKGAGGKMTDWEGNPLTLKSGDRLLASGNADLHEKTLHILR